MQSSFAGTQIRARAVQARSARKTVSVQALIVKRPDGKRIIRGPAFVCKDNIDTDQIIPAEYLTLVPSKPDEYEKLGSFAMIGLPDEEYPIKFVEEGQMKTKYPIIIAGDNFGCGSSREHAPVSIGASGTQAVVAETYARIFFRNCISTGELYPVETPQRICDQITTGEEVELDIDNNTLTVIKTGKVFSLNALGDVGPVVDAGGIFEFARKSGMIKKMGTQ